LARVFHLIRQPVALLFLSVLSKSLLLVAINSRQFTNSTMVFTPGEILSEYEFRSRHRTSQLSSPNAVPLNNVRITRSHFSLLLCSRYLSAAFRSSSLRRPWLASFCADACDEARTHNKLWTAGVSLTLSPRDRPTKPLLDKRGALLFQFRRRRMPKKLAIQRRAHGLEARAQALPSMRLEPRAVLRGHRDHHDHSEARRRRRATLVE
jgi:hypothetical protein